MSDYPNYDIGLYGHSFGGALASIMGALISTGEFGPDFRPSRIEIVTLGSPRVGNQAFAHTINQAGFKDLVRLVHSHDLIPHLPFTQGNNGMFSKL